MTEATMYNGTVDTAQELQQQLGETYLTFWLDKQLYGISIAHVVQIVNVQEITEIPNFPVYAKGVINLRGNVLPVVDMHLRLGGMEVPYTDKTCIIITLYRGRTVGLLVDRIDEVTHIPDEKQIPVPITNEYGDTLLEGLANLKQGVVMLFDSRKLLHMDELGEPTGDNDTLDSGGIF